MKLLTTKAAVSVSDAGEIEAIAWPFASADRENDTIDRAAIVAAAGMTLPMLYQHEEAIGIWHSVEVAADALRLKGRLLIDKVSRAAEVFALLKEGAIKGVSIGFNPIKYTSRAGGGRAYSLIDLLECSVVAVPCHPGAAITSVKSERHKEMSDSPAPAADAPDNAAIVTRLDGIATEITGINSRLDSIEVQMGRPTGGDPVEAAAKVERKSFVTFVRRGVEKMVPEETKALRVADNTSGGYLAPAEFSSEFLRNLVQYSPIREAARVGSMSSGEIKIPRRLEGVTARWVAEIERRQETQPKFGLAEIVAHEMSAWVPVSNTLLEDSAYDIEGELSESFSEEFGRLEGLAFVSGSGVKQPEGILTNEAVPIVPNGHATVLQPEALIKILYSLPPIYRNAGSWLLNGTTIAAIRLMKDQTGRFLWQESLAEGQPPTLLGRPVVEAIDLPDVAANSTPIVYGDLSAAYRIFDRVGFSVLRDPYTLSDYGQTKFTARRRVAGAVVRPEALRKLRVSVN